MTSADGRIELEPRQLMAPFEVSRVTLNLMDQSMKAFQEKMEYKDESGMGHTEPQSRQR